MNAQEPPDEIPRDHLFLALALLGFNPYQVESLRINHARIEARLSVPGTNTTTGRDTLRIPITSTTAKEPT